MKSAFEAKRPLLKVSLLSLIMAVTCSHAAIADDTTEGTSSGPVIIVNPDGNNTYQPPTTTNIPQVGGSSFGDPSCISGNPFTSPYRWLGAYGGVPSPIFGAPYVPVVSHYGIIPGFGYTPFGGWGGIGVPGLGFGGLGGLGYGVPGLGFGGYRGLGFGGLGGGWGGVGLGMGLGMASTIGGFGGFGGYGVPLGGFGYGGYGMPFGGYGGWGMGMMGMGMGGMGMGMGPNNPAFGRLGGSVFQSAPSKSSGNYYAPSTVDPTASGSYYASGSSASIAFPAKRQTGPQDYTKPQRNYWGSGGNPFGKDLNSTPWSK